MYQERCFFCLSPVCTITNENADAFYLLPTHACASHCDFTYSGRLSNHGDAQEKVASVWRLAELEGHEAVQCNFRTEHGHGMPNIQKHAVLGQ